MDTRLWFVLTVLAALAAAGHAEGEGDGDNAADEGDKAEGEAAEGEESSSEVTCYDCWYQSVAHNFFDDDVCNPNMTTVDKTKVANETCDGMCYTLFSTAVGKYVKRGCMPKDEECVEGEVHTVKIGWGNRTCCDTDFCNGEYIEDAAIDIRASSLVTMLAATAILFYHSAL